MDCNPGVYNLWGLKPVKLKMSGSPLYKPYTSLWYPEKILYYNDNPETPNPNSLIPEPLNPNSEALNPKPPNPDLSA